MKRPCRGQRNNDQSASVTMLLPGAFSPIFGPGSIPTTMPRALPLLIPAGYAGVDAYLKGPTVIEDIARLLEKLGVPSEVLRVPSVNYETPPKALPGFPGAKKMPSKNQRTRWVTPDGKILEWDYQHGDVEVYDKRGKHKGSADPNSGKMTKDPIPGRKTNN
jgi:hypothetical protein